MSPGRLKNFQEVLRAAIEDILENGFDSQERVDRWMRDLRIAAERSMISPASLEQQLRDGLAAVYRRQVDGGAILRRNAGVERFTLEMVKPKLRAELDRRIVASANLIKLNRAQAIDETLRRFQGWSSAIPPGGVSRETRGEVKDRVRKSMASLPFEERRVLIDQGHKLTSSLSKILAADGGAIAGIWHSHWRQAGYDYREDHKERDERVFLVRDSWAHKAGYVKKGRAGYVDESTEPGQEVYCRCYYQWLYALKDLPADMLTAKGKAALASVQGREDVRSARGARADSSSPDDSPKAPQDDVAYTATWPNRVTRCQRCSMFVRLVASSHGNMCTAVQGEISAHGHCEKFAVGKGVDATTSVPVPVDRDHDVPELWRVAPDADRMWVDRSLPRAVEVGEVTFDPAELFWARGLETALFGAHMAKTFIDMESRAPDAGEAKLMRAVAARHGEEAEQRRAREMGVDWATWRRWVAGQKVKAEKRKVFRPVDEPASKPVDDARSLDKLRYFDGLKTLRSVPDKDSWNAYYEPEDDSITLEDKFAHRSPQERVRIVLHEAGHRGEEVDPVTFLAFKALGAPLLASFLDMANPTHLADFRRTGKVDDLASEVFAESYARVMLGMPVPPELDAFWRRRLESDVR